MPSTTAAVTASENRARPSMGLLFGGKPVNRIRLSALSPPAALCLRHRRHIVMHGALMISIVPFDGHTGPVFFCDGAGIIFIRVPEYAVANFE